MKLKDSSPPSLQLVRYNKVRGIIESNPEAIKLIQGITAPIAILGICGPYRSGKSYFVSKVMKSDDFKVSHSIKACTEGIWISTSVLVNESSQLTVIVLDTEGIGDVTGQASPWVHHYLILTTLLSSYLIYNTRGLLSSSNLHEMR